MPNNQGKFSLYRPYNHLLLLLLVLCSILLMGETASAKESKPSDIVFQLTGFVENDPFTLGLQGAPFEAIVTFDPNNLNPEGNKIFPVQWDYRVGKYRVNTRQGAINLDNDLSCNNPEDPSCILFDGWQVVDEQNPVRGRIAGNQVTSMALNFQDHQATALDDYDITEPLDLAEWEVHNGTISLAGLDGEIVVFVESFTRPNN